MNRILVLTTIVCYYPLDGMFLFQKLLPHKTHEEIQKDLARGVWYYNLPIVQEALHNGADPCEIIPKGAAGILFHEKSILYHAICGQDYAIIKALVKAISRQKLSDIPLSSWAYHNIRILKLLLRVGCCFANEDANALLGNGDKEMLMFLYACGKEFWPLGLSEEPTWFQEAAKAGREMYQQRLQKYQDVVMAHLGEDLLEDINIIIVAYAGVPLDWDDILLDEQEEKEKLERAPVECIIQ